MTREGIVRRPFHRRQPAAAIVGGEVALRDVGVLPHAVDADRQRRIDHLIDVEGDAPGAVAGNRRLGIVEVRSVAACLVTMFSAPPVVPRPSMVEDGPLRISICSVKKVLADADGGIADAVDEDVVARVEAADEETVAEGVAALAGAERHAGGGPRHFFEAGGVLVLEEFLGENRDALRRIDDRLGEFRRRQTIGLIGRGRVGIGIAIAVLRRGGCGRGRGSCALAAACPARRGAARRGRAIVPPSALLADRSSWPPALRP